LRSQPRWADHSAPARVRGTMAGHPDSIDGILTAVPTPSRQRHRPILGHDGDRIWLRDDRAR
jgi:hypothetical protein